VLVLHAEIMELVSYHKTALIALVHGTFLGIVVKINSSLYTVNKNN
jgi:hypothetical protein